MFISPRKDSKPRNIDEKNKSWRKGNQLKAKEPSRNTCHLIFTCISKRSWSINYPPIKEQFRRKDYNQNRNSSSIPKQPQASRTRFTILIPVEVSGFYKNKLKQEHTNKNQLDLVTQNLKRRSHLEKPITAQWRQSR